MHYRTLSRLKPISFIALVMLVLSGCGRGAAPELPRPPAVWPTTSWQAGSPENAGLDSAILAELINELAKSDSGVHSLLIVRHGVLVLEAYFYPYAGDVPHDVASVTKSVTITLLGALIAKGELSGLDQPVPPLLAADDSAAELPWQDAVTLENLASMRSGFDCGLKPGEPELIAMMQSPDWIQFTLDLPRADSPGRRFAYCSPGMHLLSAAITARAGQSEAAFAERGLFGPLGIEPGDWPADPAGYNHGWGDLRLHPRDMAKIGLLFLHDGVWDGERILPERFVTDAIHSRGETTPGGEGYGLGWWLPTGDLKGVFEARGRGGQRIVVAPALDMIVVTTGAGFEPAQIIEPLNRAIIVDSDGPGAANPEAQAQLHAAIEAVRQGPPAVMKNSDLPLPAAMAGRTFSFAPNPLGFKTIALTKINDASARMNLDLSGAMGAGSAGAYQLSLGLDGRYRITQDGPRGYAVALRGAVTAGDRFKIDYVEPAGCNRFHFALRYEDDRLTVSVEDLTGLYGVHELVAELSE